MRIHRSTLAGAAGAAVLLALGSTTTANAGGGSNSGSGGNRTEVVEMEDDCHPPTFNTQIVPGVEFCDPDFDGDTTAAEFFAEIAEEGEAGKWRFHPDDTEVDAGTRLRVVNVGGELHTFTPVEHFGGGCVPDPRLDIGEAPVEECDTFDPGNPVAHEFSVLPGGRLLVYPTAHRELYQCLIHPWMRAVVEVDGDHSGHH